MLSLRLSRDLEQKLRTMAETEKISKSEVVKQALALYFDAHEKMRRPYDLGQDLFGRYGSGRGNLSRDYKKIVKGKVREKHSR